MSQVNQARLAAGFSKSALPEVSVEENDVNININAETEGGNESTPEVVEAEPAELDVTAVDEDAIPLDTSETPEASELEVQDVQSDADDTVDDIEELDNSLDSLESIYFTLANISAEGMEVTPGLARLTHVAVQNAVARFNLTPADCGIPSVEAMDLAPEAEVQVAMEGILETAKAGAKQIVEQMKKLIAFIAEFVKSVTTAAGRTEKRIGDVEKAVRGFKGTWNESVTVPAVLNGWYKGADLSKAAEAAKSATNAKYADLAVAAKATNSNAEGIRKVFAKANAAALAKGDAEVMPGVKFGQTEEGALTVNKLESKSTEAKVSQGEVTAILAGAKKLVDVAKAYDAGKNTRKQISDTIAKAVYVSEGDKDVGAIMANKRKFAKAWSRQLNEETRVVGLAISYANAATAVVAQGMRSKKAEAKA